MKYTPHKTRQQTIKWFMLLAVDAIILAHCASCAPKTGMKGYGIIQECRSPEGISVVYRDNSGIWAADYLTKNEYDSLLLTFKDGL
jgi:hypothetical protein